jgi:SAM-dependent methyltransferase
MHKIWHQILRPWRQWHYPGDAAYWERRYALGGDSGSGSAGLLARHKADTLNFFVKKNNIATVVELGCGDGQQAQLFDFQNYTGLDIAPSAVARCAEVFAHDDRKRFVLYAPDTFDAATVQAELTLSLEVIFHLTDSDLYEKYLRHLFATATRWVVIFAPNQPDTTGGIFPHVRLRAFLPDVARLAPQWCLAGHLDPPPPEAHSWSTWWVFERIATD